eukprot:1659520-Pyramimonas_sp.AAC.2
MVNSTVSVLSPSESAGGDSGLAPCRGRLGVGTDHNAFDFVVAVRLKAAAAASVLQRLNHPTVPVPRPYRQQLTCRRRGQEGVRRGSRGGPEGIYRSSLDA